MIENEVEQHKSNKFKIILLLLIFITIIAIIVILFLNLRSNETEDIEDNIEEVKEEKFLELEISTTIFNHSDTPESLNQYFLENPIEQQKSAKLSENFRACKNTNAEFSGNIKELNGYYYIEDNGENCFVSYRSDFTIDCNYTKEQMKIMYDTINDKGMGSFAGPAIYFTNYLEINLLMLRDIIKEEIDKETSGETLIKEKKERNIINPKTGEKEIINCLIY